jgi:hypothetical protein
MKVFVFISAISLVCISLGFGQTIKLQTHIKMDNLNGIPYSIVEGNINVDGFDVDDNGNYYFLVGNQNSSVIVKFSGEKKIFRKTYSEYIGGQLYIYDKNIFVFNQIAKRISLYSTDGSIVNKYDNITSKSVNSYRFVDGNIVIDMIKETDPGSLDYDLYTLFGKRISRISNPYNLPSSVFTGEQAKPGVKFIGKWNGKYIFWEFDENRIEYEKFWLVNEQGTLLKTKYFQSKQFGLGFEYISGKLRNGNIFVLGHNGKDGIVTELSTAEMFK